MRLIMIVLLGFVPSLALAGQFTCENDEVVSAVKTKLACSRLFSPCSSYGLPDDYDAIQSLDNQAIKDRFNREYADVVLSDVAANERRTYTEFMEIARVGALSAKGLFRKVESLAIDHNPSIDRYVCQLSITYEPMKLKTFVVAGQAELLLKMPEVQVMIKRENGHQQYLTLLARIVLGSDLDQKIQAYGVRKALFSVQPSEKSRFAVDIIKFESPMHFFKN